MKIFNINKHSDNLEENMYIIGTVGPNVKDRNSLKGIIDNGVNALRFNFAHGSENDFDEFLKMAKEISSNIDIILDLSGTKVRVSNKLNIYIKFMIMKKFIFAEKINTRK